MDGAPVSFDLEFEKWWVPLNLFDSMDLVAGHSAF